MSTAQAHKLGFEHGELFAKKNPFTKGSNEFIKYEEGYKLGIGTSMKVLPGEAVLWGTLIIFARFFFEAAMVIQLIMLFFIPWMVIGCILCEVLFFYTFGSLFPSFIKATKRGAEAPLV